VQDVYYIDDVEQAMTLLHPLRIELLKKMEVPRTCPELAGFFEESPQKVYYHVKALEKVGLVDKVEERRVRGVVEGYYQAKARSYWLAPQLVGKIGGEGVARGQMSLRMLLSSAEMMHEEVGRLGHDAALGKNVPSLALNGQIYLPDGERREEFLNDVEKTFKKLARKYGIPADVANGDEDTAGQIFRLIIACYPASNE